MSISLFDLFSIGIGPSSSHTVGPMKAARAFAEKAIGLSPARLQVELFGSLAFTGRGHGTDLAILLGLEGQQPDTIDPDSMRPRVDSITQNKQLLLAGRYPLIFDPAQDFIFNLKELLPRHSNGMRFTAMDASGERLLQEIYYSIGGGFIVCDSAEHAERSARTENLTVPFPFSSMRELLAHCDKQHKTISEIMLENEKVFCDETQIKARLLHIADVMRMCIDRGCQSAEKILPGGLQVKRRAPHFYQVLQKKGRPTSTEQMDSLSWLNLYAIAVNEENAAGKRVVTAPTNGAAGIIPAVLYYWMDFSPNAKLDDKINFLLTAGAIAILYKKGASISGAEAGCQGEVGVACSMAAAGLAALQGGSTRQIENAAEIAMEHHLGMTCDPIAGLVQIPCIERNAMGAVKAVNAARLALMGDGHHVVSLDKVIATMKQTGLDMLSIYKETSLGGLAANLPEC